MPDPGCPWRRRLSKRPRCLQKGRRWSCEHQHGTSEEPEINHRSAQILTDLSRVETNLSPRPLGERARERGRTPRHLRTYRGGRRRGRWDPSAWVPPLVLGRIQDWHASGAPGTVAHGRTMMRTPEAPARTWSTISRKSCWRSGRGKVSHCATSMSRAALRVRRRSEAEA